MYGKSLEQSLTQWHKVSSQVVLPITVGSTKKSIGFFHKMLWKSLNELFGQPNISVTLDMSFFIPADLQTLVREVLQHTIPLKGHPHHILYKDYEVKKWSEVAQSCPILCDPMDCSLLGSSLHGILLARILEWVAISSSRGSFWPRGWTRFIYISYSVGQGIKPKTLPCQSRNNELTEQIFALLRIWIRKCWENKEVSSKTSTRRKQIW